MATGGPGQRLFPPCSERTNYARLCRMIVDLSTGVLREFLLFHRTPQKVEELVQRCPRITLTPQQWLLIQSANTNRCAEFDITLLYTILRNANIIPPPKGGWGMQTLPGQTDVAIGDDIERIRIIRNQVYGHIPNTKIDTAKYQQICTELQGVATRFDQRLGTNKWNQELKQIEIDAMDPENERRYINTVSDLAESDRSLRIKIGEIDERIDGIDSRFDRLETEMKSSETCRLSPEALTAKGIAQSLLQLHKEDQTFLSTKAIDAGLGFLDKYGIAIFTGKAGSGKTSNAKEVMKLMQDREEKVLVMKISDPTKWDSCVNPEVKSVVLLDDILGKTNVNESKLSADVDIWNTIFACIRKGDVKVLMTIRSNILSEALNDLGMSDLFKKEHIIDLSSEAFQLTNKNKRDMFDRHCRANNITICEDENQENYKSDECLDKCVEVKLSDFTVKDIIFSDPFFGFPQSCFMFCRERKYTQLGACYFNHPTESMVQQLEKMRRFGDRNERISFCLLVYVLLNDSVHLDNLNMCMVNRITDGLRLEHEVKRFDLDDAVKDLRFTYLIQVGQSDIFEFRHQTVLEAVAIACANQIPNLVLELCSMDFIREFIRTQGYKNKTGEVTVKLRNDSYIFLINRFIAAFRSDQCWFVSHNAFDDHDFVSQFFSELNRISDITTLLRKDCNNNLGMFNVACMFGKILLIEEYFKTVQLPQECVRKGVGHAQKTGQKSVLLHLLLLTIEVDEEIIIEYCKDLVISSLSHMRSLSFLSQMRQSRNIFIDQRNIKKLFYFSCNFGNLDLANSVMNYFREDIDEKCLVDTLKAVCNPCNNEKCIPLIISNIKVFRSGTSKEITQILGYANFHIEALKAVDFDKIEKDDMFRQLQLVPAIYKQKAFKSLVALKKIEYARLFFWDVL